MALPKPTLGGFDYPPRIADLFDAVEAILALFDEAVDDRVSNLLVAGTNVTLTYDDVAGTITIDATGGGGTPYTDEEAQDAVGTILADTATIDLAYADGTPAITAAVKDGSIGAQHLSLSAHLAIQCFGGP